MTITIYGIKTCDTVRKARAWLDAGGHAHAFVDYRAEGLDPALLDRWIAALGWQALLNRASTTFKELPEADRQDIDAAKARALMLAHPTLIKRPVLDAGGHLSVGFRPGLYEDILSRT